MAGLGEGPGGKQGAAAEWGSSLQRRPMCAEAEVKTVSVHGGCEYGHSLQEAPSKFLVSSWLWVCYST